jgi:hypothetical protein
VVAVEARANQAAGDRVEAERVRHRVARKAGQQRSARRNPSVRNRTRTQQVVAGEASKADGGQAE